MMNRGNQYIKGFEILPRPMLLKVATEHDFITNYLQLLLFYDYDIKIEYYQKNKRIENAQTFL